MNGEHKEDETGLSISYRSPTFSKEETKALVNIIDKYKTIILNKSTSAAANHTKEAAWSTIAKMFNSQGFIHSRSAGSLKTKWENLKKEARKMSKNLMEVQYSEFNDVTSQVVNIISEVEKNGDALDIFKPSINGEIVDVKEATNISCGYLDDCDSKELDESDEDIDKRRSRSSNFSAQECSLLLQCVREQKKDVFCKDTSDKANQLKNSAWTRIAESFNKKSPQRRSTKVLRTKFSNMKWLAKSMNLQHYLPSDGRQRLEDTNKEIKVEPVYECKTDVDIRENSDEIDSDDHNDSHKNDNSNPLDPLDTVLNGDSGFEPMQQFGSWSPSDSKDVVNLKLRLLNYQMETAKMERKRLEETISAEAEARERAKLEQSLRLRAARLEALAAESKLPSGHQALQYTVEESLAQQYLQQYNT